VGRALFRPGSPAHACLDNVKARGHRTHYLVTTTTGEWDTLICRVPVSAKPIMAKAPISMQIVINRSLGSLILAKKGPPLGGTASPLQKERVLSFLRIARAATSDGPSRGR